MLFCGYAGQLHRFLARLTEASHGLKGRTVLYLPQGNMADPVAAATDKVLPTALRHSTLNTPICKQVTSDGHTS